MLIIHDRISKNTYNTIIDKIKSKLSGWKANQLYFAGVLTLAQLVLQCVLIYFMNTAKLLGATCDEIDFHVRHFLWGGADEKKKLHLIK
ncbi:hypothetical protein RCOM_1313220 [Ricinus communis]|uniref:Uncharacterized protein n=1 Tax=Ricinus communis TaxID=3988 RepID=B9RYT9_RICCO|nr:hypothetical protein RCOM_1313220 [Ricinus communis]